MKKRMLSIILAVVMIVGMIPLGAITAFAEVSDTAVPFLFLNWSETEKNLYEDFVTDYELITSDSLTVDSSKLYSGWYVVKDEVTFTGFRVIAEGDVNLILCDGAKLTASKGISVPSGNSLTIYGQENGTGELIATADSSFYAGIGGDNGVVNTYITNNGNSGSITVNGGKIRAQGGFASAGIGGGLYGVCGEVTINGGDVTAIGGYKCAGITNGSGAAVGTNLAICDNMLIFAGNTENSMTVIPLDEYKDNIDIIEGENAQKYVRICDCKHEGKEPNCTEIGHNWSYSEQGHKCTVCGAVEGHTYENGVCACGQTEPAIEMPGDGTQENPYEIRTLAHLYEIAVKINEGDSAYNSAYYVLCADIGSSTKGFENAIGKSGDNHFQGHFDGQGHTVWLNINKPNENYVGLFRSIGPDALVSNVKTAGSVNGKDNVGGICGRNYYHSTETNQRTVINVSNCSNSATVTGSENVGGISGFNWESIISNCSNSGNITGSNNVGGISGSSTGSLENCSNTGNITGNVRVGGVAGKNNRQSGWIDSVIINCYNKGKVTGTGSGSDTFSGVGGICGFIWGKISNSYNNGTVIGCSKVGGIFGAATNFNYDGNVEITNCYNSAKVIGNSDVGGIYGFSNTNLASNIKNCFYDREVYTGNAGNGTGLSTAEMKGASGTPGALVDRLNNYSANKYSFVYPENFKKWDIARGECPSFYSEMEGSGTQTDPYIIKTVEFLEQFADEVNGGDNKAGKYYVLGADIDTFTKAIGNPTYKFQGHFDGRGHTVSLDIEGIDYVGLFGYIDSGAVVCNVKTDGSVSGINYVGGICGYNYGGTISGCSNGASVICNTDINSYVGGICGYNCNGTISGCSNNKTVSGKIAKNDQSVRVGGICGCNNGTTVGCNNTAEISCFDGKSELGGICGYNVGEVYNCYNGGMVTKTADREGYIGGICGHNDGEVYNCYNGGTVSGKIEPYSLTAHMYVGGICGYNGKEVYNCYNFGEISSARSVSGSYVSTGDAGGICCVDNGTVSGCYYDSTDYSGNDVGIGLPTTQMQAASGTDGALVDKLNSYIANNPDTTASVCAWDVKTGEYPKFALRTVSRPTRDAAENYTYTGEAQTYIPENFDANTMNITNNVQTNVGEYTVTVSLKDTANFEWNGGGNAPITFTWKINRIVLEEPTASDETYTYTGEKQTFEITGFDKNTMSITNTVQTNAGEHTVTVSLKDTVNYEWSRSGTDPITFIWTINKADYDNKITDFCCVAETLTLPGGPQGMEYKTEADGVTIIGNTVEFSNNAPSEVTVTVSSTNYKDYTFKITKHTGNTFNTGTYKFFETVIFDDPVVIEGEVEFVLDASANVMAHKGICLTVGNTLIISGTGKLFAIGAAGAAGIGGNLYYSTGKLIVNGGEITAVGGFGAAGIGGFGCKDGEFIENGGSVESIDDEGYIHVHTFETGYTFDENHHWHECTCKDEDCSGFVFGFGEHTFGEGVVDGTATVYTCTECGYQKTVLSCDINGDGKVDATDLALLKIAVLSGCDYFGEFDCNGDGNFDILDIVKLKKALADANAPLGKQESEQQPEQPATEVTNIPDKKEIA